MTMSFGNVSKMTIGAAAKSIAVEGGSVVAGLLSAGALGNLVEKNLGTVGSKAVLTTSTMTDKIIAYVANNGPKAAMWYILKKEGKVLGGYEEDIEKGIVTSVVLDTFVRATNNFAPKAPYITIGGINFLGNGKVMNTANSQTNDNLHRVLQENSTLRGQLNSAMARLASAPTNTPINVTATPIAAAPYAAPPADHDRRFGMMSEADDRRNKYGAMTPPIEEERNRRFGAMDKSKMNFAGEDSTVASAFGML